ncbi:Protein phosphatase 1J [Varanus komodoensis]|nr:Protein phosphatase 1J [Varanus komodoensis]
MATIGVTRGLGDHDLKVYSSNIHIKPFLSCIPEVRIYDLTQFEHCPDDVLVLGTDGLWDVTTDQEVANVVFDVLMSYEPNDPCRYTMVAQELVMRSRGVLKDRGWRLANDKLGSGDDISVFSSVNTLHPRLVQGVEGLWVGHPPWTSSFIDSSQCLQYQLLWLLLLFVVATWLPGRQEASEQVSNGSSSSPPPPLLDEPEGEAGEQADGSDDEEE